MGRIKIVAVKTLADEIITSNAKAFGINFEKNKKALDKIKHIESKRIRNILAGYITREMKKSKKRIV